MSDSVLKSLAKCSTVESYLDKQRKTLKSDIWSSTPTKISYNDLNMRTFSMLFAIGGCIMILLLTSLITMKFVQRKRHTFQEIFSPQLDPLLFSSANESSSFSNSNTPDFRSALQQRQNGTTQLQRSQPTAPQDPGIGSIGSSSDLNRCHNNNTLLNAYLPSYEEALLQQPISVPIVNTIRDQTVTPMPNPFTNSLNNTQATTSSSLTSNQPNNHNNKSELIINETTSIIEIAPSTLQSLGIGAGAGSSNHHHNNRSRSGSMRSNLTIRSATGSIRTNNSAGTTNSNTSFNLPPPSSSLRKNNIRARHRLNNFKNLSNHNRTRGFSNQTVATQDSQSPSETTTATSTFNTTTTTAGGSSLLSNQSDASVIVLRGSVASNVDDTTSNLGSI